MYLSSGCYYHHIVINEHLPILLSNLLWLVPWVSSAFLVFLLNYVYSLKLRQTLGAIPACNLIS